MSKENYKEKNDKKQYHHLFEFRFFTKNIYEFYMI